MNTIIHKANERGNVNHGWLKANHSFSFANYYDPKKEQFGTLRVLNDDVVEAGFGFGMHPHNNMEIVTIPLKGALKHKDSSGGEGVIKTGERFFEENDRENKWQIVVSPNEVHNALWINQDAYFSLGNFDTITSYKLNNENNGVYLMVIEGEIEIDGNTLTNRDAIGITDATDFQINVLQPAKLLAIEVPMK